MHVGFDPTFVDIFVRLMDNRGHLIENLPPVGYHHRTCLTDEIAGGNGVNVARTLGRLGEFLTLVIPADDYFISLLKKDAVLSKFPITKINGCGSNRTIALITSKGEIQLNAVTNSMGLRQWSKGVHQHWLDSPAKIFLNWGLNPLSHEWVSCQILSLAGYTHQEIHEIGDKNVVVTALKQDLPEKYPIFMDTGLIGNHPNFIELAELRSKISETKTAYVVGNEEEETELRQSNPKNLIIHSARNVQARSTSNNLDLEVPKLPRGERNYVGAGDAFLAGLIKSCLSGQEVMERTTIQYAIEVAQCHILNRFD